MKRLLPLVICVSLAMTDPAVAQGTHETAQGDTLSSALGYAALALAGTVWAAMSAVIGKLWKGLSDQAKLHQAAVGALSLQHKTEVDSLRAELAKVQADWRTESEKLLREQRDIMREVMMTTSSIGTALDASGQKTERLSELIEHLTEVVESWQLEE